MPQGKKTRIKIIDCRPVYHGTNVKGDSYTIHELKATNVEGTLIDQKLRSFSALPVGQLIDVTVVPFESPEHGKSFTIYPANKAESTTQAANDLRAEINELRTNMARLAERVGAIEGYLRKDQMAERNHVTGPPVPAAERGEQPSVANDLDARFGADAPFS